MSRRPEVSAVLAAEPAVSIMSGERDDPPGGGELVPPGKRRHRPIEKRCERRGRSHEITEQRAPERESFLVAPLAVGVHPLDSIQRSGPIGPRELAPRRERMRSNTKAAHPGDVFRNGVTVTSQRIGRLTNSERDVVAVIGADFDAVDTQHAVEVLRRVRERRVPSP